MSNTTPGLLERLDDQNQPIDLFMIADATEALRASLHLAQYIADNADEVSPRVWSMAAKILEDVR